MLETLEEQPELCKVEFIYYLYKWEKWLWRKDDNVPEEVKKLQNKLWERFPYTESSKDIILETDPNLGTWEFIKA